MLDKAEDQKPRRFVSKRRPSANCTRRSDPATTTVSAVVQHYLARVRAYNGVASMLVTQDGAPVPAGDGRGARRRAAASSRRRR